jgi:hypothetical protein
MTRHQWLGSKRWLLFRSKVVICQGIFEICFRLERNIPAKSRVHHVPLNDTLMVVVAEDILLPELVLELVLRLVTVLDDPGDFIHDTV